MDAFDFAMRTENVTITTQKAPALPASIRFHGRIRKKFYVNGPFAIASCALDDGSSITIKGNIADIPDKVDIEFVGEKETSANYGEQYSVSSIRLDVPTSEAAVLKFLSGGFIKGIGVKKAQQIYAMFKGDTLSVLNEHPERLLEIPGIKKKTADRIIASYRESFGLFDLINATGGQLSDNQIYRLKEEYGADAVRIVKEDPYRIIRDIPGIGFKKADAIAMAAGVQPYDISRIGAAVNHVLIEAAESEGHCFLPKSEAVAAAVELLNPLPSFEDVGDKAVANASVDWPELRNRFIRAHKPSAETLGRLDEWWQITSTYRTLMDMAIDHETEAGGIFVEDDRLFQRRYYLAETKSARIVADMVKAPSVSCVTDNELNSVYTEFENTHGYPLGEEQKAAINMALNHRISCITGGPGRGKTTIISVIVREFSKKFGLKKVILLAPTGRAAKRITESSGYPAMTVHRLIGDGTDYSGFLFICDEASMVDILLFAKLLDKVKDSQFVLVGDVDQLASVGAGAVLKDVLASSVESTRLITGHRNEGSIAHNAALINAGYRLESFTFDPAFRYIPCEKAQLQATALKYYEFLHQRASLRDILFIVPMKTRGSICTVELNRLIQEKFNPEGTQLETPFCRFREGDRVMHTKNEYRRDYRDVETGEEGQGVFNGDVGSITHVDPEENELTVLFDDGRESVYSGQEMGVLILAYAITVHKCQGSEAKYVLYACGMENYIMLKRNLVYTAVTRAKAAVFMVGTEEKKQGYVSKAIDYAIRNIDESRRYTALAERINMLSSKEAG